MVGTLPIMSNPNDPGAAPPPPEPPPASPPRALRLGDVLVVVGALLVFGFSFAPFARYSDAAQASLFAVATGVSPSFNAWSLQTFMVPLTTFVVVAALLGIAAAAVRFWFRRDLNLLGFRLRQLEVGLALFVFLVLLGMIASDKHVLFGARRLAEANPDFEASEVTLDTGWGAVLMLIGAIIALVGALLNHFSVGPEFPVGGDSEQPSEDEDLFRGGGGYPPPPPSAGPPPPGGPPPGGSPPPGGPASPPPRST